MRYLHLFSALTATLESFIVHGGYAALFISTTLEGIPLIGMAVPGHVVIIIAGFLARIGTLSLPYVLILAIAGAILGDFIGFSLGRKYGFPFIDRLRRYFFVSDEYIERTKSLLARHTGKAMIIGRFSPVTRALMPFFVGASPTSSRTFWIFNVIGGVSWAVVSIFLGYAFGAGYHAAAGYAGKFVLFSIILSLLIMWGYRFVNVRFHIFRRYELFVLILNVLSLAALAKTIQNLVDVRFSLGFDVWTSAFMQSLTAAHQWVVSVAGAITTLGGAAVTASLGLVVGLILAARQRWRSSALMILSVLSAGVADGVMKDFFLSPRPPNALYQFAAGDYGFPSGHAALAAAFFISLAYVLTPHIRSWVRRELFIVGCVLLTLIIGLTRVVLNVHWASDVIGGWTLGVFCATASILFVRYVGALVMKKAE